MLCWLMAIQTWGQKVSVCWELSDPENLSASETTGENANLLTASYLNGTYIAQTTIMTGGNAADGYTAPAYTPPFTQFYVTTRQTGKMSGHNIAFGVKPQTGHTFKPTKTRPSVARTAVTSMSI